jgi:hypothetical protein
MYGSSERRKQTKRKKIIVREANEAWNLTDPNLSLRKG